MSSASIALITADLTSALGGINRLAGPSALNARCELVQSCYALGHSIDSLTVGELLSYSNTLPKDPFHNRPDGPELSA